MIKKIFFVTILLIMLAIGLFVWRANFLQNEKFLVINSNTTSQEDARTAKEDVTANVSIDDRAAVKNEEQVQVKKKLSVKVPFTSQAPRGNWKDQRFQDGCEEASIAMAMRWVKGETFSSPIDAEQEIFKIAKFEEKTLGHFVDTDVDDVGKIMSKLYGFSDYVIKKTFVMDDLKNELEKGAIILVPAHGRALKNPNFTSPGPIAHMLVIVGYDAKTKEFVTNDPGTKKGEGYRYDEKVLFEAIWAYPSGKNHPSVPKSTEQKAALVIKGGVQ